jgi:hypothetical protein
MNSLNTGPTMRTRRPRVRFARVMVAAVLAGMFTSACMVHDISKPGAVKSLSISPNPQTLAINGTQQFTAVARDFDGVIVSTSATSWSVVANGGTISSAGVFTAGTAPQTFTNTVMATVDGMTATATVIVVAGPLATITVTPTPISLVPGATQQYTAVGRDASGNVIPITPSWSVVAGGGAINPNSGLFTAGSTTGTFANTVRASVGAIAGVATVTVTAGPLASVTVSPNPGTMETNAAQQYTAVGRDANGNIVVITPAWAVVNGGGSIDAGSGVFTAGNVAGTYSNTVRATSGGISGTATAIVTPVLASLVVTPNPANMQTNSTQQFSVTGRDGSGNVIAVSPVWTVINGGGTIGASSGLFTSGGVTGTFNNTVKATSGTVSGTATVNVSSSAPAPIVNLGTAAPNGIMAGTAFTCVSLGVINANISISPGSTVTGFPPCVITGVQHLADAVAAQAQIDLTAAYNVLAGLPCSPANTIVANLGGTTKSAGVYCSATSIGVTGTLTLDGGGDPDATFVFQAGTGLTTAGNVVLINGAQAKNVYWQVGSSATIGTASQWQGNILALTSITLVDNANLLGRALARNGAVSLGTNNVITLP